MTAVIQHTEVILLFLKIDEADKIRKYIILRKRKDYTFCVVFFFLIIIIIIIIIVIMCLKQYRTKFK